MYLTHFHLYHLTFCDLTGTLGRWCPSFCIYNSEPTKLIVIQLWPTVLFVLPYFPRSKEVVLEVHLPMTSFDFEATSFDCNLILLCCVYSFQSYRFLSEIQWPGSLNTTEIEAVERLVFSFSFVTALFSSLSLPTTIFTLQKNGIRVLYRY